MNYTQKSALAEGALPRRFKLLIATVLDAVNSAPDGVQSLAREATKEEITEAIRVAQCICGVGCVYTAARAFKDVFGTGDTNIKAP